MTKCCSGAKDGRTAGQIRSGRQYEEDRASDRRDHSEVVSGASHRGDRDVRAYPLVDLGYCHTEPSGLKRRPTGHWGATVRRISLTCIVFLAWTLPVPGQTDDLTLCGDLNNSEIAATACTRIIDSVQPPTEALARALSLR